MADKGWACSGCGCSHNYSTRATCRWCSAKCPSKSLRQNQGGWKAGKRRWWDYSYNPGAHLQNQNQAVSSEQAQQSTQESVPTDNLSDKQQLAQLRQDINRLIGVEDCEDKILLKKEKIKAIEQHLGI